MGIPAHRRRAAKARHRRVEGERRERSAPSPPPPCTPQVRTHLGRVSPRPGQGHRRHRLLHRRHRVVPALLRALRDRARTSGRPPPRRYRESQRALGDPGGPELHLGARRRRTTGPVLDPRPRHQVHRLLRPRLRLHRAETIRTPIRSPRANAFAERWVRTAREDCLDHVLVLSRRHLETILADYVDHYNRARPHRGLQLAPPQPPLGPTVTGTIRRRDILGGLIHEYELAA